MMSLFTQTIHPFICATLITDCMIKSIEKCNDNYDLGQQLEPESDISFLCLHV